MIDADADATDVGADVVDAAQVETFQAAGDPVISVDTKKKELVGPYKNAGSDYRPKGCPDKVNVHDFVDKELGKAIPYESPTIFQRRSAPAPLDSLILRRRLR